MSKPLVIFLLYAGVSQAETKLYTDGLNLPAGSSYQIGNITFFNDAYNLPAGTRTDLGSVSLFANSLNLPAGSVTNIGPSVMGNDYQPPWETKRKSNGQF